MAGGHDAGSSTAGVVGIRARWQAATAWQRRGLIAAAMYIVYAFIGYFLVSPLARDQIVAQLSEQTGRNVVLDELVFNPLALSVSANGFALKDQDKSDFVAFDQLYLNFELSSLARWSWHFGEIALVKPRIRVTQHADESLNFADLIAKLSEPDASAEPVEEEEGAAIPAISIAFLTIDSGNFVFRDEARATPGELSFNDLSFEVTDFSTRGNGGDNNSYTFEVSGPRGGRFLWAGQLNFNPLVADGKLALEGLQLQPLVEFADDRLNFSVPTGEMDFSTHYRYEADEKLRLTLSNGVVALRNLEIDDQRNGKQAISIAELVLSSIELDTLGESVTVGEVNIRKPELNVIMEAVGANLETLFIPVDLPTAAEVEEDEASIEIEELVSSESSPETESSDDWTVLVKSVRLNEAVIAYQDNTLREPAAMRIAPLSLTINNLSPSAETSFDFDGTATIADSGLFTLAGDGQLVPFALHATVGAEKFPLASIQPWLRDGLAVQLPTGELSGQWKLDLLEAGDDVDFLFSGESTVNNLVLEEEGGEPLLAFSQLQIEGINVDSKATKVEMDKVAFDQLVMSSLIDADGKQAADRIVIPLAVPASSAQGSSTEQDWRVLIGQVTLADSSVEFTNKSVSPDFRMGIYQLAGSMNNLDSTSSTPARLDMKGKVDKYAPFSAKGALNPLAQRPVIDIEVLIDGYEMTSLTPFTGEYLGYAVKSGQLTLDTVVELDDTFLYSKNNINAANFFLGDKVESEEALKVPIKLGLAVLRNRSGVIAMPVVAKGDLSDPSVSARGLILKALGNVLVKAATSPFSMLAGLAGGADLSGIPFSNGQPDVGDDGRNSLVSLVSVMEKRPHLKITLSGSVSEQDRMALAASALGTEIQGNDWSGLDSALPEKSIRRRILKLYEQQGKSAEVLLPDLSTMTGEQQTTARIEQAKEAFLSLQAVRAEAVTNDQLQALAAARAQNTKAILVEEMNMDAGRLFIADPVITGEQMMSGVLLGLTGN
jgi:uncharacterized protein involved in outer membrane biogenesis